MSKKLSPQSSPKEPFFSFYNPKFRALIYQVFVIVLLVWAIVTIWGNMSTNLAAKNISTGFAFLERSAGFPIGEGLINYTEEDTYARAILVGFINTIRVAVLGCILATIIGVSVGIGRLSSNFLLRSFSYVYVETVRNIPPLVHLLAWYFFLTSIIPSYENAISFSANIHLFSGGLVFPHPNWHYAWGYGLLTMLIGLVFAFIIHKKIYNKNILTGKKYLFWPYGLIIILVLPLLVWKICGAPNDWTIPQRDTFGFINGGSLTPEFITVLVGLSVYTACFIAEIVRSGIQAVPKGQIEAGGALGLSPSLQMRLVILPQALRVIIPPLTNQYLNLTKNSSLAVAVGYPDLVSTIFTTNNQSGQAVECVLIMALVYLSLSLITSLIMNWYNRKIAYKSR